MSNTGKTPISSIWLGSDFITEDFVSEERMTVEVQLLTYKFKFRKLTWREESGLKITKKNPLRPILIMALEEVSGIKIKTPADAAKVINALPAPVAQRVFIIYKGLLPTSRTFETANVYRAPDPSIYVGRKAESQEVVEKVTDKVMDRMEQDFGKKELEEAAEIDRQIVAGSKLRGAVKVNRE